MTGTSRNRWRRQTALALAVVLGLLLVSCDKHAGPTGPSSPPPPPSPTPQQSTGPIAFVSDRDGTDRIYLANEDGSAVTPLVEGWEPAWAKDGRRIAFRTVGRFDIRVIGVDKSGDRVIADRGSAPSWSPDGRSLVFVSWRDDSEIDVVNADGSNRRSLYDSGVGSQGPKWSPDGQRIVFSVGSYQDWCFGLWTVNVDGSGARQLGGAAVGRPYDSINDCFLPLNAPSLSDGWLPAWSPDGSEVAFAGDGGISVARADGSGRQLRVPGPVFDPDWTPDGRLIYTKTSGGRFAPSSRIFIVDGGTERQLIPEATAPARSTYRDWAAVWLR